MALITTPGSNTADSYATLAYADTLIGGLQVPGKWADLTEGQKEILLKNATQDLDRFIREHIANVVVMDQALAWPFWYRDGQGEFVETISADSGSVTTIVDDYLESSTWPSDFFNGGSAFVKEADEEPPEFELKAVTDFVRSTGTITTEAFTVAVGAGDTIYLICPAPRWLKDAQCYQALFLSRSKRTASDDDMQSGITSRSFEAGGSVSYRENAPGTWLCKAAYRLLIPNIPTAVEVGRG